jgi:CHAT domain-containing protein
VGAEASKARLRAGPSPRVLHLATPSFFLSETPAEAGPARTENPMRRSGLVLAGANAGPRKGGPRPESEDGLLTAENITGLDLYSARLTVLSLTDATLNAERATAALGALQRAFVQAGTRCLVMSLWRVPDPQRRQLLEDLYRRLLAGTGCSRALREARLAMKAGQPDPRVWGGFLCLGDPGADIAPG